MNATKAARHRNAWLGFAVVVAALPACHSIGPWARERPGEPSRIAYKPAPASLRGRAFYVSGYGGADYSPGRPHKVRPVDGVPAYVVPSPAANPPAVTIRQGTWDEP